MDLASLRDRCGISQIALASRMGVHRVTLRQWEKKPRLDPVRAARYRRMLRQLVDEATA